MEIVVYIFAMIAALIAVFVLALFLSYDIKQAGRYKRAERCRGTILENAGTEETAAYGRNQYRKYGKYRIQYTVGKETYQDEILLRDRKLKPGDGVEVRYIRDENGISPVNDVSVRRLKEIIITFIIVVSLCIYFIYTGK
ncbi:MAG: hypothetical protein J5986_14385 [Roseburia sp.]|nr:hypothetical protein [Roseburia sp.]